MINLIIQWLNLVSKIFLKNMFIGYICKDASNNYLFTSQKLVKRLTSSNNIWPLDILHRSICNDKKRKEPLIWEKNLKILSLSTILQPIAKLIIII